MKYFNKFAAQFYINKCIIINTNIDMISNFK